MTNLLNKETLSIDMESKMIEMSWSAALIEWESGGFDDIPTKNLIEFKASLTKEIEKRSN